MGFAAPLALLALFALVIPVAIHLLRRHPRRTIRVGSIRHLAGVASARSVRMSEPWLLALRILIVTLCALVLAEPYTRAGTVERGVEVVRVLPAGADVWSRMREADAELPRGSSITLVVPSRVRVAGPRPALRSDVAIRMLDVVSAPVPSARPPSSAIHSIPFFVSDSRRDDARYLRAALRAVADARGDSLEVRALDPDSADTVNAAPGDWIVWLADSTVTSGVSRAVRAGALLLTDSAGGAMLGPGVPVETGSSMLVRRVGRGLAFTFGSRFVPAGDSVVLSGELPDLIASIWPDPTRSAAAPGDWHRITEAQLLPSRASRDSDSARQRSPIGDWLLIAGALLFLLERYMAHRQRTAAA